MSIRIKTSIVLPIILLVAFASRAQNANVYFGYDANGNRISRALIVAKINDDGNKIADTIKSFNCIAEDISILGSVSVSIYPNPTHDKLTISLYGLGNGYAKACILATSGAVLIQHKLLEGVCNFDLSKLPPGVYMFQMSVMNMTRTWKIIKN